MSKAKLLTELVERAKAGDGLAMDYASRMARAKEQGYMRTYHGTPAEIPESGFRMGEFAESDLGQGIYSTTSPYDASYNYADVNTSQDLQGKIERRAEFLEHDLDIDYDEAKRVAASEIAQSPNVMETMARVKNPVRIGGAKETHFDLMPDADIEAVWDDASEQVAEQYADEIAEGIYDEDEIKSITEDFARELAYENDYVDEPAIFDSLRNVAHRFDDVDIERAISDLAESGHESMSAEQLVDTLKDSEGIQYATSGDTGDLASGELIRQAFEDAGYDSIIDATPNKKWGSESGRAEFMPDLEGTEHVIVFNPNQMRSVNAAFDPAKKTSSNLLASAAPLAVGLGALSSGDKSYANIINAPGADQPYSAAEKLSVGMPDQITGASYPVLGGIASMLHSIDSPFGKPYETTAELLGGWAYGRPSSTFDKLMAIGEIISPESLPSLVAGGAEYLRKQGKRE